jgi:hypothetical protein
MISYTDVEKLLAVHSEDPPVLSLYLEVPLDQSALHGLPARAGDLLDSAAGGPCGPAGPGAGRVLDGCWRTPGSWCAGCWRTGHATGWATASRSSSAAQRGLTEAIPLPTGLGEQAVFGPGPHVRPLLLALQRQPAYRRSSRAGGAARLAWPEPVAPTHITRHLLSRI